MPETAPEIALVKLADHARQPALMTLQDIRVAKGGRAVLDGLTLNLGPKGLTALMGPNGAGKSLTLRLIAGLIVPDAGSIRFADARPPARQMAMVFQKPVLLRRSVRGNLNHALRSYGVPRRERPHRIADLLAMAGLSALADTPARRLSGGEQQRIAMVRALAARPKFLLLDEPTASLDPASTKAIEELIRQAVRDGVRTVLVTHDRGQAARLADDILFMHNGRLAEARPAADFFDAPSSPEARAYLAGELLI